MVPGRYRLTQLAEALEHGLQPNAQQRDTLARRERLQPAPDGLALRVYAGLDELAAQWRVERRFYPTMSRDQAAQRMADWERAVRQARVG